jgi:tRNA(His) 5'-end guanylyltransferase
MDKIATIDFSSLMVDSFNRGLAEECMDTSNQVLDCIHVLIFDAFPLIIEDALRWRRLEEWRELMPLTYNLIQERGRKSPLIQEQTLKRSL